MNYYPFHLGDYAAHTAHLEPMEDLAYRRLLDHYYLREGPLPADIHATAKLIRMRSMAADVESVLREFFVLTEEGWRHDRCDAEIERMQDKQAKARASAQASVNARRARSLNVGQTDADGKSSERSTNAQDKQADVELPTPTPKEQEQPKDRRVAALTTGQLQADGLSEETADEWLAHRKRKGSPLTPRAWASLKAEVSKAGWTLEDAVQKALGRGWTGIEAEWLRNQQRPQSRDPPRESIHDQRARFAAELTGQTHDRSSPDIIDIPARRVD